MADEEVRIDTGDVQDAPVDIEARPKKKAAKKTKTAAKKKKAVAAGAGGKKAKAAEKPKSRRRVGAKVAAEKEDAAEARVLNTGEAAPEGCTEPAAVFAESAEESGTVSTEAPDSPNDFTEKTAGNSSAITVAPPEVSMLQGAKVRLPQAAGRVEAAAPATVTQNRQRIVKVHRIDATLTGITSHIIMNKAIVQGRVHLQIFFVTEDQMVHHLAEDVPFHAMLEIPGARPGMTAIVQPAIAAVLFHLSDDGLTLVKKILIDVFVKVVEEVQTRLLPGTGPELLLQEVVGEGVTQTLSETIGALDLPALKVEEIRGELKEITTEVIADKVIIQGLIHKQIFFVDENNLARHQSEEVPFSVFVDIPGASPGMNLQVMPRIETIIFELLDPTTLRQKVVIEVFAKVTTAIRFQAALGQGPLLRVAEVAGEGRAQTLRRDLVTLARPAAKIREITAVLQDLRRHVIQGKAILQGIIHKQIFYIGLDDGIEYHQAEDVPFNLMVDIPGAAPGQDLVAEPVIESVLFNLLSPTELEEKVIIAANLIVVEQRQLRLVTGDGPLALVQEVVGENISQVLVRLVNRFAQEKRVVVVNVVTTVQGQVTFRRQAIVENQVELPVEAVKVAEVNATVRNLTATPINGGILLEGEIVKDVKFVGTDDVVRNITEAVPFSVIVNFPETTGQVSEAAVEIEQILFSISPDGRAVRQVIVIAAEITVTETETREFQLITEVQVPGLAVESVLVEEPVLTPDGVILQQFPVITGLSGPGLALVESSTFGQHTLNVVGVGPQTLNVLEAITVDC